MSDPLFTHLWTLSMAFVLMQVKTGFDTPIFNYILHFFFKSGMISVIYHIYSKSFIEIIMVTLMEIRTVLDLFQVIPAIFDLEVVFDLCFFLI